MTTGLEIRAQIDTESVKALLLMNGGASVALLAFLPTVLGKPGFESLARGVLWALLIFQVGLVAAVVHNLLRRVCSLKYEREPVPCEVFGKKLRQPCVCYWSLIFVYFSVAMFVSGSVTIFCGGMRSLEHGAAFKGKVEASSTKEAKTPPTARQ